MSINNIFQFLVPKDKKFFPLFEQATQNLVLLAEKMHEAVNTPKEDRDEFLMEIERIESVIEGIAHQTNLELSRNFITPFDREDIYALMSAIDNVADYMYGAGNRMRLYQVENITKSIRKLTEINLEACQLIQVAVADLKDMKNLKGITDCSQRIYKLESKSDNVFERAVADIFEKEKDPLNVIKYKEVLSALETATDKCKGVANVLESIAVKHS
ncbi:DUF47 domain-containing protein [Flavobacterium litorale]|uniref:DUF47 family protein n=1 Tax=Flavobacterium litorale TaxID=2856519 RepID=A0ABX8V9V2_9FLAO|nr:DUF47 family protein [Flavobacterium litorale]QYJ67600.1 DUF47 family protein [Flavobacterium litorale]